MRALSTSGLSGAVVRSPVVQGALGHGLADGLTFPAPFAPSAALMGGNLTYFSALNRPHLPPIPERTAHALLSRLFSLWSIKTTLLHPKISSFSWNCVF